MAESGAYHIGTVSKITCDYLAAIQVVLPLLRAINGSYFVVFSAVIIEEETDG
jgi:hypothetical protein